MDKIVEITICDDCIDFSEDSKTIYKRNFAYCLSAFTSVVFVSGLLYWTYVVLKDIEASNPYH